MNIQQGKGQGKAIEESKEKNGVSGGGGRGGEVVMLGSETESEGQQDNNKVTPTHYVR